MKKGRGDLGGRGGRDRGGGCSGSNDRGSKVQVLQRGAAVAARGQRLADDDEEEEIKAAVGNDDCWPTTDEGGATVGSGCGSKRVRDGKKVILSAAGSEGGR
ncbi:hypothetical protein GW17_00019197 [Ensete ventricosum]|uniref:Uncharacterized protein n=1 Tax=Ensete ventricosum TaxID=4639 RepID=A0A444F2M9_ENSVE|nr:hypothetical protein GW17_00019197 [Ensete ventricosum]RZR75283.1 hypothetical protein BHM03_00053794 [Ensete ventricosum]